MSLLSLIRRLFVFALLAAAPVGVFGFSMGGKRGLAVALALLALIVAFVMARAERGILSIYRVRREAPEGARRSLARVVERLGGTAPRIFSFSDPAPQALVARGLGSPGAIVLSEGLLGALNEDELRELLEACIRRIHGRGISLQTVCAWLAHGSLELAPRPWIELLFGELRWHESLGVFGALRFIVIFTVARFFTDLGRAPMVDAPRSLVRLPVVSGEVSNPGSRLLHFRDPWASRGLLA